MRLQENDTEIKIPNWYLKLPQKILNFFSDAGIFLNNLLFHPKKTNTEGTSTTTFYL